MNARPFTYRKRTHCAVCAEKLENSLIDFLALPVLTGVFSKEKFEVRDSGMDQSFYLCPKCGHGQLSTIIDPNFLYNQDYGFQTSLSQTATNELEKFVNFLEKLSPDCVFNKVVDIGCNDLYLLKRLKNKAKSFCGVDMMKNFADRQKRVEGLAVDLVEKKAEDLKLSDFKSEAPDLIVATHMIEHAQEPREVLCNLMNCASEDALFVFEFPCLEEMTKAYRFDRIFHQHLQYFSLESFKNLLILVGAEYIDHCYNPSHWGSLMVAFRKGRKTSLIDIIADHGDTEKEIKEKYFIFKREMKKTSCEIEAKEKKSIVGYGATNMLPILFYHLGINDNVLDLVFDDDIMKNNLYFQGLGVRISNVSQLDQLCSKTFLITALDHVDVIVKKLLNLSADKIIIPLQNLP
ncbi:MAG: class I SAM-dependent methyltransferase [Candidatus Omnitrophica bacterium]|nr:class I SAM-dependent methyltransferase [Candidatus Omnitrophota bacterium]